MTPSKPTFGIAIWVLLVLALMSSALVIIFSGHARADQEASNVAHVVSGADGGRCYARSVPTHVYDPDDDRQAGVTEIYTVGESGDELIESYDWFAQQVFVLCNGGDVLVVRVGPWQRGHAPRADHLALAFYRGGEELSSFSTLDIAGPQRAPIPFSSQFENVSVSVSHYTVFDGTPQLIAATTNDGPVFSTKWFVRATTVDGRRFTFDPATGRILP